MEEGSSSETHSVRFSKLSVVIPVYNSEETILSLVDAVVTLLKPRLSSLEVILVMTEALMTLIPVHSKHFVAIQSLLNIYDYFVTSENIMP